MPASVPQAPRPDAEGETKACQAPGLRSPPRIDRRRFRRFRWFFVRPMLQTLWRDFFFRLPALAWFRPSPRPRWQAAARRYRQLATEMGGVMIKLGQFLSTRVDLFPPEVTQELTDLRRLEEAHREWRP